MPVARVNDLDLYYEVTGEGYPLVFAHEFAGSHESWEAQVRFFARNYRVITYNARGYPPSDVPQDLGAYSQDIAVADLYGLLKHLSIEKAFIGGLSMGGSLTLNFGLTHPEMCRGLVVAGAGTGSDDPQGYAKVWNDMATQMEHHGMDAMRDYVASPTRVQLRRKDPRGYAEFVRLFNGHSATGSALTFRGVQAKRPAIYRLEERMRNLRIPTLILCGDEDEPCIGPSIFMKRCIPTSGLVFFPQAGHTINLEEPEMFNRVVQDFLSAAESGHWATRDPGASS